MYDGRKAVYSTALAKSAAISIGTEDSWVLSMDTDNPAGFSSQKSASVYECFSSGRITPYAWMWQLGFERIVGNWETVVS